MKKAMQQIMPFMANSTKCVIWSTYCFFMTPLVRSFLVSLGVTAVGYWNPISFITFGYGGSIAGQALMALWSHRKTLDALSFFHLATMLFYGCRLFAFLVHRDQLASFQDKKKEVQEKMKLTGWQKVRTHASSAMLYTLLFVPALLNSRGVEGPSLKKPVSALFRLIPWGGLAVSFAGVVWEMIADAQKQAKKVEAHDRPMMTGLFKHSQQANYFGELLTWWGSFLAGSRSYSSLLEWAFASLGVVGMTFIMRRASKSRSVEHHRKYKNVPEWEEYNKNTPTLIPIFGKRGPIEKREKQVETKKVK